MSRGIVDGSEGEVAVFDGLCTILENEKDSKITGCVNRYSHFSKLKDIGVAKKVESICCSLVT